MTLSKDNTLTSTEFNQQAYQGNEKNTFFRICKLLTRNIQLIFVFDGPGKPHKHGKRGGNRIDYERQRLLKDILRCFGIPYHDAPGEADAECARLQTLGLVDAVWSQDSDCPMFGCSFWIHDERVAKVEGDRNRGKEYTVRSGTRVRLVRAGDLKNKLNLDREGLVLFVMLVGGDYDQAGLPNCGRITALEVVKKASLAHDLCQCRNQRECAEWGLRLQTFLQTKSGAPNLVVPQEFPNYKTLQKYYRPTVSSDEHLMSNRRLDLNIPRPVRERELLQITSSRFNIWGRRYLQWVGPVLLTRSLLLNHNSSPKESVHDIKLTKQHESKSQDVTVSNTFERKIKFSPFGLTVLQRDDFEGGDREGMWEGKVGAPFDLNYRVPCDYFPTFVLRQALSADALGPSKQKAVKRKERPAVDDFDKNLTPSVSKKHKPDKNGQEAGNLPSSVGSTATAVSLANVKEKDTEVRLTPPNARDDQQLPTWSRQSTDPSILDKELGLRLPPGRKLKRSPSARESSWGLIDNDPCEISEDDDGDFNLAIQMSMQQQYLDRMSSIPTLSDGFNNTISNTNKNHGSNLDRGLEIRKARLKHFASDSLAASQTATLSGTAQRPIVVSAEYIDLTED